MWIYFFDYKGKTTINNYVYKSKEAACRAAYQIGRAFGEGTALMSTDAPTSLLFEGQEIQVYIIKLNIPDTSPTDNVIPMEFSC